MGRLSQGRLRVFVGAAEAEVERRRGRNRLKGYQPYAKQAEFHAAGARHRERLFMAGNQLGKTVAGAAEVAMHLTGLYPDGWDGFRFERPGVWICASESAELTRDGVQRLLLGPPSDSAAWGTGFIPADCLIETSRRSGVPDAVATCLVKHVSGGHSTVLFKSYDQGRSKWQAAVAAGVGLSRFLALLVNGLWRRTPFIRAAMAMVSLLFWSQISLGLVMSGVITPGWAVYPVFTILEFINVYFAMSDARVAHERFAGGGDGRQ